MVSKNGAVKEYADSPLYKAWLQYAPVDNLIIRNNYGRLLSQIVVDAELTGVVATAVEELLRGARSMLDVEPAIMTEIPKGSYLHIQIAKENAESGRKEGPRWKLERDAFTLRQIQALEGNRLELIGGSATGVLYGVFHLLRLISLELSPEGLEVEEYPSNPLRMMNQWDNADATIERGYAGNSIFYEGGRIVKDVSRVRDYARLLSSVGINGISINNVNVHDIETSFITEPFLPDVARLADLFRAYGITLFLSINFAAPITIGGLDTADPLDDKVHVWWENTVSRIYDYIPDFGGFLVKADSEHRPGPFAYGRDHADGANMLADALERHGGLVIWRCFVYNCMQDWRDRSTDRARAAYEHFKPLDGRFRDNVILQIKNGPMDFQVREPVSPLFGAMKETNQIIEFQITQEYTGQQHHLCYLIPQWKRALDFDTHAAGAGSKVKKIVEGSLFEMKYSGIAAISNIGDDENWTGHPLAQANLYGYGRLTWNSDLTSEEIAEEWTRMTFGNDKTVVSTVLQMLMDSWPIYENYTAPLGVGWMVTPHYHYGPDVDGYEYSRWGTYHFADRNGMGVDRTTATGTGYAAQYFPPQSEIYESLERCPDELLLFFHHVPYNHRLQSGKTVIQHIYDTHFLGAEQADRLQQKWEALLGKVDTGRYQQVADRLAEQAEHAKYWRDVINTYFYRKSGITDEQGRTIY
ncbi:alpha-glucuronidase family glycosyl hydrolase [Paenibacillus wynnii]|uniref:alpha-glucuronidase family glycosyl hydrolase n=1 Tax=Paenibacillus wynnii TaxID=268407 RepID=UPI00278C9226|nr:alpha-glucuronidase family glycosyl hydrolase [Paenibacillus wynnii]MDQ0194087.1 alpha-glucuronidase [Paenibacillus wynnii]